MSKNYKQNRLGRGLNSLLGDYSESEQREQKEPLNNENNIAKSKPAGSFHAEAADNPSIKTTSDAARVWKLAVDKIKANKKQPRKSFDEAKLKDLAESIKEQGILQPIIVRQLNEKEYEIVAGERRWRAAQIAGLHNVPVIIRKIDEKRSLELAIIENVQRADLNPVEEAEAYYQLQQSFSMSQSEIAKRVGKERATVANLLRLLQLVPEVRQMLVREEISQGHAKALLSIEEASEQKKYAKKAIIKKWSVRQLEKEIKKKGALKKDEANATIDGDISKRLAKAIGEDLQKIIGSKVEVEYSSGKGKLSLHFYSDEQLNDISDRMKKAWM